MFELDHRLGKLLEDTKGINDAKESWETFHSALRKAPRVPFVLTLGGSGQLRLMDCNETREGQKSRSLGQKSHGEAPQEPSASFKGCLKTNAP